jgi:hypothetical protein
MAYVKQVSRRKKMDERETRDLQDNQLTNPKTRTPSKNKTRRKKENSISKHIGMPNIWKR